MSTREVVLSALKAKGPQNYQQLVKATGLRGGQVSGTLHRLEKSDIVKAKETSEFGRVYTPTGKPDNGPTRASPRRLRHGGRGNTQPHNTALIVRVQDANGRTIALTLQDALEVERQLNKLRKSITNGAL